MKQFFAALVAILLFTGPASAEIIDDSRQICIPEDDPEISGETVVTYGDGGEFQFLQNALRALGHAGGVIEILPGVYEDRIWIRDRGDITIRGVRDAECRRPHLIMPINPDTGRSYGGAVVSFTELHQSGNVLTVEDLEISGARGGDGIAVARFGGLILRRVYVHDNRQGVHTSNIPGSFVEIADSEFARNGNGGNTVHNIYIGRSDRLVIRNTQSHSSWGGHALKSIARYNEIVDSVFETTRVADPENEPRYLSTTLIDIAACGRGVIARNTLVHHMRPKFPGLNSTGKHMLHFRARRTIQSCDEPPYNSEEFWSSAFWQEVVDGGLDDPENPYLFNVFVSGNTFVAEGPYADRSIAIQNDGTYPIIPVRQFGAFSIALEVPPEWVERSRIWVAGNAYSDIMTRHVEGPFHHLAGDFQPDIPRAPIIVLEGDLPTEPVPEPDPLPEPPAPDDCAARLANGMLC